MFKLFKGKKKGAGEELHSLLGNVDLPSFNATVMNVLRLLRDPESSMHEIADHVQIDPGMNVKVLRTVNSAAYGLASKVGNIRHAVTMLGRSRLESIVLSVAVRESLPKAGMSCLNETRFWETAAKRASVARALAERLHPATKAESFTAAFLQDMAVPVIMNAKQEQYIDVLEKWFADSESMLNVIENDAFGYDHSRIGALMAETWELPEHLIHAIADHHSDSADTKADPAVRLVSCMRYDDEDGLSLLKEKCISEFDMDEQLVDEIIERALKDAEELHI